MQSIAVAALEADLNIERANLLVDAMDVKRNERGGTFALPHFAQRLHDFVMPDITPELLKEQARHQRFPLCQRYPVGLMKQGSGIALIPKSTMLCVGCNQALAPVQHGADHGLNDSAVGFTWQASVSASIEPCNDLGCLTVRQKHQCQRPSCRPEEVPQTARIKASLSIAQLNDEDITRTMRMRMRRLENKSWRTKHKLAGHVTRDLAVNRG